MGVGQNGGQHVAFFPWDAFPHLVFQKMVLHLPVASPGIELPKSYAIQDEADVLTLPFHPRSTVYSS